MKYSVLVARWLVYPFAAYCSDWNEASDFHFLWINSKLTHSGQDKTNNIWHTTFPNIHPNRDQTGTRTLPKSMVIQFNYWYMSLIRVDVFTLLGKQIDKMWRTSVPYSTKDAYNPTAKRGEFQPFGTVRVEGWPYFAKSPISPHVGGCGNSWSPIFIHVICKLQRLHSTHCV